MSLSYKTLDFISFILFKNKLDIITLYVERKNIVFVAKVYIKFLKFFFRSKTIKTLHLLSLCHLP